MDFIESRKTLKRLRKPKGNPGQPEASHAKGKANPYQYTNTSYRPDLGVTMRSNWEANVARVFSMHGIKWEFEPETFRFEGIKRGTVSYVPDFYLPKTKEWVEVKGFLDNKSKIKIKRFKKFYPEKWGNFVFIVSRYSKNAIRFAEEIGIPTVLFYEDFRNEYKDILGDYWQGK